MMPLLGSKRGRYEIVLDPEEQKERRVQQRMLNTTWVVLAAVALVGLVAMYNNTNAVTNVGGGQYDKHTIPTLLSVVHHETGDYVLALDNPVYENLKRATFIPFHLHQSHHQERSTTTVEFPSLQLDKVQLNVRDPLTLSWTMGKKEESSAHDVVLKDDDVIALYCGDQVWETKDLNHKRFLDAATIAQARATSQKHGHPAQYQQEWHFPSFPVLRHELCQFNLYQSLTTGTTDKNPTFVLLDTSPIFEIRSSRSVPTGIHLALGNDATEMVVQFTTGDITEGTPVARYNKHGSKDSNKATGTSHTYTAADMCEAPANITEAGKFQSPGNIHVIRLTDLEPNTDYEYKVGLAHGQGITWSESYAFTSPQAAGDASPFSYLVYGDQGCPSNGWGDGGEWIAAMTAREVSHPKDPNLPVRAIHHFGDLSYAKGAAHVWDDWFHMISSFTTKVPLMVAVGNHEYDHMSGGANGRDPSGVLADDGYHPIWGNFHNDSGGECGVPTANHFTMPNSTTTKQGMPPSNGVFWYSYDFGSVHTIVTSSEHDMGPGSVQYTWLEADLSSVDRSVTPWVIMELHRPLYDSEDSWENNAVGVARRLELDDLLVDYKVDLVLSGHYHSYLRTCDGLYNSRCNNGGPMHITVGSAGAVLTDALIYPNDWTDKYIKQEFGYGRITVANASDLLFEFVKGGNANDTTAGEVRDSVWITRER